MREKPRLGLMLDLRAGQHKARSPTNSQGKPKHSANTAREGMLRPITAIGLAIDLFCQSHSINCQPCFLAPTIVVKT